MPNFALPCHGGTGLVARDLVVGRYTFCAKAPTGVKNSRTYSHSKAVFILREVGLPKIFFEAGPLIAVL
jgi:hypothetical protein